MNPSSSAGKSLATVLNLCDEVTTAWIGELVGRQLSVVCLTIAYTYWGSYAEQKKNHLLANMENEFPPYATRHIRYRVQVSLRFKLWYLHLIR